MSRTPISEPNGRRGRPEIRVRRPGTALVRRARVVALVAALAAAGVALASHRIEKAAVILLERSLAEASGAAAKVGGVRLGFRQGLQIRATDVDLRWPAGSARVASPSLMLAVRLLPLLRGRLAVRSVELGGGTIEIGDPSTALGHLDAISETGDADAELRLTDLVLRLRRPGSPGGSEPSVKLEELVLTPARGPGSERLVRLTVANLQPLAPGPAPRRPPQLRWEGRVRRDRDALVFDDATLFVGDLRVEGEGRLRRTERGLTIARSRWTLGRARFSLTGDVFLTGGGPSYSLRVTAPDVPVESLRSAAAVLRGLWPDRGLLAEASGSIGAELSLRPGKAAGAVVLRGVTIGPRGGPPAALTGPVKIDGDRLLFDGVDVRADGVSLTAHGSVEGWRSSEWRLDGVFEGTVSFPEILALLPPNAARRIAAAGTVPVEGRAFLSDRGGSFDARSDLRGLEQLDVAGLRKARRSGGRAAIRASRTEGAATSWDLELDLSAASLLALPVKNVRAEARAEGDTVDVRHLAFEMTSGRAEGRLTLEPSAVRDLEIRVRDAEANEFLTLFGVADRLHGKLSADVRLAGLLAGKEDFLERAQGQVDLIVEDGRLENVELPGRLLRLATIAHEGLTDFNLTQALRTLNPEPLDHFELLSATFDVADGVARTENLVFDAHDLGLEAKGELDLSTRAGDLTIEGRVPKIPRDHAGLADQVIGRIRLGEALNLMRRLPGLESLLGPIEEEHVFRLRLSGNLLAEINASDFTWVH